MKMDGEPGAGLDEKRFLPSQGRFPDLVSGWIPGIFEVMQMGKQVTVNV